MPLNNASTPAFGTKWDYLHVTLYCLNKQLGWMILKAKAGWRELGWPEESVKLFSAYNGSTVMVDLLTDLQEFLDLLKARAKDGEVSRVQP